MKNTSSNNTNSTSSFAQFSSAVISKSSALNIKGGTSNDIYNPLELVNVAQRKDIYNPLELV